MFGDIFMTSSIVIFGILIVATVIEKAIQGVKNKSPMLKKRNP